MSGGRFVPVGVKAVYASFDEETALREVTARRKILAGRAQIELVEYPRLTYVITLKTHRSIDLAAKLPSELQRAVTKCVCSQQYLASQELAGHCIERGVDSLIFPSATGAGRNIVVYLPNAKPDSVTIRNRNPILTQFRTKTRKP